MSRTRIVIFQLKEIIYTAIFVGLGILLLILLFFMFWPGKGKDSASTSSSSAISRNSASTDDGALYKAGVYNSELSLGDNTINIQVALDSDHVKSVELVNLDDSVETMYPLIKPAVKEISQQLAQNVSPEEIVLSEDSPYTSQLILNKVSEIMQEASVDNKERK